MNYITIIFAVKIIVFLCIANINCDNENLKVICYWPSYHEVEAIKPELCTHIHYAFFILNETDAKPVDEKGYPNTEVYAKLNDLKSVNPSLKIIPSIGGWGDAADKYSRVMANDDKRQLFVQNTYQLVMEYGFDGFDIDWEFPVCWQDDCDAGDDADRDNFSKLIKELREEFDKNSTLNLSLSAAVKGDEIISSRAYNFEDLDKYLDYICVMTYDDYGYRYNNTKTKHHSGFEYSIENLAFYHNKGVAKSKLLIGVPFYGRSFTLINANENGIGAPIVPMGLDGAPALDYVPICNNVKSGNWTQGFGINGSDPYAYYHTYWIGYDDPQQVFNKSKYVKDNGFGGVIIWEIGIDDIKKECCTTDYPLLRAINYGLYNKGNNPDNYGCNSSTSVKYLNIFNTILLSVLIIITVHCYNLKF